MTADELRALAGQDKRESRFEKDIKKIDEFLIKQAQNGLREVGVRCVSDKEEKIQHYKNMGFMVNTRGLPEDCIRIKW